MTVPRQSPLPVFAFEFTDTFTTGGTTYLRDFGPNSLHAAFLGGGTNPTAQLDGSHSFDGGDYLALPLTFYTYAPTGPHTWLAMIGYQTTTGTLFSCRDTTGAVERGISYGLVAANTTANAYVGANGAALNTNTANGSWSIGATRVLARTVETTCRALWQNVYATTAWSVGAYNAPVYSTATVPWIGAWNAGLGPANLYAGRLYYLALLAYAATDDELLWYATELLEGRKPYCWR